MVRDLYTVADYRIGGIPRWLITPYRDLMRLPDEVLKCVVFIGHKDLNPRTNKVRKVLRGTGFFVGIPTRIPDVEVVCLVTARHVAEKLESGEFFIRANLKDGGVRDFPIDAGVDASWLYHPSDETVDAAVLFWAPPADVDMRYLPANFFLTEEKFKSARIGPGDPTYVTGLYSLLSGTSRNFPVVRTGNVAMMPTERIPSAKWKSGSLEGYLVEARSIGGLSGSPVFVARSIEVQPTEASGRAPLATGAIFWLGLIHGHTDVLTASEDDAEGADGSKRDWVNVGIATVVPSIKVIELFEHPEVRGRIEAATDQFEHEDNSVMDDGRRLLDGGSPQAVREGKEEEAGRAVARYVKITAGASNAAIEGSPRFYVDDAEAWKFTP